MHRPLTLAAALCLTAGVAGAGELKLTIDGVADEQGTIRVALYGDDGGFMKPEQQIGASFMRARTGQMTFTFHDLPSGRYAAAVFHDANGNGELDANMLGVPTEGFGFSANAAGSFGPPDFGQAAVTVSDGAPAATAARLSY